MSFCTELQFSESRRISNCPNHPTISNNMHRAMAVFKIFLSVLKDQRWVIHSRSLIFQGEIIRWKNKTGKRKGVKQHLSGLVDAPVRVDDTAYGCLQSQFQLQRDFRFSQSMLFFTTAAHFTWLRHVHLHITTSHLLKKSLD
jgi:hypothetical protein